MIGSNICRLAVGQPHNVCRAVVHPHDRRGGVSLEVELRGRHIDRGSRGLDRDRLGPGPLRHRRPKIPVGQLKTAPGLDVEQPEPRASGNGHHRAVVQGQFHPRAARTRPDRVADFQHGADFHFVLYLAVCGDVLAGAKDGADLGHVPGRRGGDHERNQQHKSRRCGNRPLPRAKHRCDDPGRLGLVLPDSLDISHDNRLLGHPAQEGARVGVAAQQLGDLGLVTWVERSVQVPQQKFVLFLVRCHLVKFFSQPAGPAWFQCTFAATGADAIGACKPRRAWRRVVPPPPRTHARRSSAA